MRPRPFIIPFFIPNIGCPHRCVYCNQTSITGYSNACLLGQLQERIGEFLRFKKADRGEAEIAFYGGNFLGLEGSQIKPLLDEAQKFIDNGQVRCIRFSTRPDTITEENLEALSPYAVGTVELGAQSMDNRVLALSRRGHTVDDTVTSVLRLRDHGLGVGLQIMPGLPGDTPESIIETGERTAELQPDCVRIYPTVVVKNTVLERWYDEGSFKPISLADAVELTKRLYMIFKTRGIPVIRMGLQATSSLLDAGGVVAGPFHPAFGHLVYSALFLELAIRELERQAPLPDRIVLRANPLDVSKLRGLKNENIRQLAQRFRLNDLRVIPDPAVAEETVKVAADK